MPELDRTVLRIFQRQFIILIVLAVCTIPLFLFTRSMAARNREMDRKAAQFWYERAEEELREGQIESAADSLRNATTNDHDNATYTIRLATTLATLGHIDESSQALLRLREANPESAEINLDLARLAAGQNAVKEAIRYYHSALYGAWSDGQTDERRRAIRFELVQFLLDHHDKSGAISELLILDSDLPRDTPSQVRIGNLFLQAGEPERALVRFSDILKTDSKSADALIGAGEAEFQLGEYAKAQPYLQRAASNGKVSDAAKQVLDQVDLIVSNDPLTVRLGPNERQRRIMVIFRNAADRLADCISRGISLPAEPFNDLRAETAAMDTELQSAKTKGDLDLVRSALSIAAKIEMAIPPSCGVPSPIDKAIVNIARQHKVNEQ